ncbi:MAG TPA: 50S ribosomal protein L32 [Candidatus Subteraquimicrobiales bacterium]
MAVPKRKSSKARRDKRRSHWKASKPTISECPQCHQAKLPHHICQFCGYYDGKQILEIK